MYFLLYSLVYLISWIPRPVGLQLGDALGMAFYYLLRRRRKIALSNLTIAFGDSKNKREREGIAKRSFKMMGRHFFETCYLVRFTKERISSYVRFAGMEHFQKARAEGKGVAVLTAHFGCWELFSVYLGYFMQAYIVVKPLDFKPLNRLIEKIRTVSGIRYVSKEKSMRRLLQLLRQEAVLGILLDQNIDWKDGVFVPFFNKRACTNKGLALLVHKTQVPVIPTFIVHEGQGHYRVEFQPALPWISLGDRTKEIEENTAQYNQAIEAMARRYPDQYFWVHQRWKTRPYQPWPKKS
jgi:Kdo2-lipid IVA lauroyltransferase/acyltransferase